MLTTTDADLSLITVAPGVKLVTVRCLLAPGYIQALGGTQGGAPSGLGEVSPGDAWDVSPEMTGGHANGEWSFTVARNGDVNAKFIFWASVV